VVPKYDVAIRFVSGFAFFHDIEAADDLDAVAEALNRVYDRRLTGGGLGAPVVAIKVKQSREAWPATDAEAEGQGEADVPVVVDG
jgi:hypothetical protein